MRRRHSLRIRVSIAFAVLGAVLSLLFALGIWVAAHDVSQRLMDETLSAEMADYKARRARNPESLPPATASLRGYLVRPGTAAAGLPAPIAALPPGRHELLLDGIPLRVAVEEQAGERYVLLFDETRQQRRERRFLVYLAAGVVFITIFATLGGVWLAGQVIAPVTELAEAVLRADPDKPPRLGRAADPGDEIDRLANAFDHYLARLAAFVERERAFAADASHELRTPLAVIRGAVEVLSDDPGLDETRRERIARIERAAAEMSELTDALLLLARERNAPVDTPCDAGPLAARCVERYRPLAAGRGTHLQLEVAEAVLLPVPPALFAIVVANLVHNAVAHTRNGRVLVTLDRRQLVVADSGSGIPGEDLDRVFDRHFRGPESSGAGIGLSLVKRVCERVGWQITLDSTPMQGTTATLGFGS